VPLIDLHCHTTPLSHDSFLTPDDLVESAKAAGLEGVCLTEHDFFWDLDKAADLGKRHNFLVIAGNEVNTEYGHMLVFGLDRFVYGMHRLHELSRMVQEAGGAMVFAHPYRRQLPFELRHGGDWSEALTRAMANEAHDHVDAIEVHNGRGSRRENEFAEEIRRGASLPGTAGSDAHQRSDIGVCATEFEESITGLADLIQALKGGRCRPVNMRSSGQS